MRESHNTDEKSTTIEFGEYIDIANIVQITEKLSSVLDSSDPIIFLNGEEVERVDAAGLQLIAAFFKDAKSQSMTLHWHKPSTVLITASRLMGLSSHLKLNSEQQP